MNLTVFLRGGIFANWALKGTKKVVPLLPICRGPVKGYFLPVLKLMENLLGL
jgi:hypothetical protein